MVLLEYDNLFSLAKLSCFRLSYGLQNGYPTLLSLTKIPEYTLEAKRRHPQLSSIEQRNEPVEERGLFLWRPPRSHLGSPTKAFIVI